MDTEMIKLAVAEMAKRRDGKGEGWKRKVKHRAN